MEVGKLELEYRSPPKLPRIFLELDDATCVDYALVISFSKKNNPSFYGTNVGMTRSTWRGGGRMERGTKGFFSAIKSVAIPPSLLFHFISAIFYQVRNFVDIYLRVRISGPRDY